jgi:hypothetical protein
MDMFGVPWMGTGHGGGLTGGWPTGRYDSLVVAWKGEGKVTVLGGCSSGHGLRLTSEHVWATT